MAKKKDCMFQFMVVIGNFMPDYKNIEDTGLITWDEAVELFNKHKETFLRYLEDENAKPEMGIWIGCKDTIDYRIAKVHLDNDTKWDGRRFYNLRREYVEL